MLTRKHRLATGWSTGFAGAIFAVAAGLQAAGFDWQAWGMQVSLLLVPVVGIPVMFYLNYLAETYLPPAAFAFIGVGVATLGDLLHSYITGHVFNPITALWLGTLQDFLYNFAKKLVGQSS